MTSLQKQLAAIAVSSTHQLDLKAQKAAHGKSLVYEPRVAASQSFESIYLICHEGFRDLCALDRRFLQFAGTLFSEQSKAEDRTQMNRKENEELNSSLEAFITLVGPRLLLKPAEKALEWLVRRFRVHEYNTECLVLTFLPYHSTPQFLALLSILPPDPQHMLRFLFPYITPPMNPPRHTIVYTAVNTPAFFAALQAYVVKVLKAGHHGQTLLSFWAGITAEATNGILDQSRSGRRSIQDQRTEELLVRVFPTLNKCLRISGVPEAVLGCYVIIIVLVAKGAFEDKVLDSLMEAVIRSQEPETLDDCLMCLAVIAEERSHTTLPNPVVKRLLKMPALTQRLVSLSIKCRVERFALGYALGILETLRRSVRAEEGLTHFQEIVKSQLLDDSHVSTALSASLRLIREEAPASTQHGQLLGLISRVAESPRLSGIIEKIVKGNEAEYESLGLSLPKALDIDTTEDIDSGNEEMLDTDQAVELQQDASIPSLPPITISSFLEPNSDEVFQTALTAFEQVATSRTRTTQFMGRNIVGTKGPPDIMMYLSFLIRSWCSHTTTPVKVAALRSANELIRPILDENDFQALIPYLIYALVDTSPTVRRAAASCVSTLSKQTGDSLWSPYGSRIADLVGLDTGEAAYLLSSAFAPTLEECVMDRGFIITSLKSLLDGAQPKHDRHGLNIKSAVRIRLIKFLTTHAAVTPILRVRLCLLPLLHFHEKSTASVRSARLLPVLESWCTRSAENVATVCEGEKLDVTDVDREHMAALIAREPESVELLKKVISGSVNKSRPALQDAAFERLAALWPSMRSDSRLSLSQCLLDLALEERCTDATDELCRTRSLETLRAIKLDTPVLIRFIESIPSTLHMPDGPPAKKRRRTSRTELARVEMQSTEDITRLLRRLTLVLELVEGSTPGEHPTLFKNLFAVLGDLQQLKQQSGSDLVYLQSLVLGSLTPIVNQLKDRQDASEYQASVRVDLLIDCIRHSTSPQVQNGALLLIAGLASWVPELVLHNLMPIFTFIGSTLLRQNDDYSAHVVDQTISRVVPQLAISLRSKHKNFVAGVSDLLLSFTAAFEHIPHHRRLKLFTELARTLGPEDSLSAIIALLVDRYPTSGGQQKFVPELLLKFGPTATLQMFKGYLNLIADAVSARPKVSDTLFGLNEKHAAEVDNVVYNLLSSLAKLATNRSLQSHIGRAFRKARNPAAPRAVFADIVETTIRLSKEVVGRQRIYDVCSRVLAKCLDMLPTIDLVKSAELLLNNADHEVQIAAVKAIEVRAGTVIQNDQQSVSSMLSFIPRLDDLLQQSTNVEVKIIAISCLDHIIERFGKKDVSAVAAVASTVSGAQSLASDDDRVRVLSLLCLTSMVAVLGEEAISLLPAVLPTAFEYLNESIEQHKHGLHDAVFALLSNVVERLAFMFSWEDLSRALRLAQCSANADLNEGCVQSRRHFYRSVSKHLDAKETFTAIKKTWLSALVRGYDASREQLDLVLSTIENQTKSKMINTSKFLFSVLLEVFELRAAIISMGEEESIDEAEVEQLEDALIESVIAMTLKLNDATFRPFFVQLVDRVTTSSKEDQSRSITFCKFLAAFFDRFKSIVTSYASYTIEHFVHLLNHVSTPSSQSETDSLLRTTLLNALRASFTHDLDSFWQTPSHFGAIMEPLLTQLTIPPSSSDITTTHVIPTITSLASASSSSIDNHRSLNTILLRYVRAEEAHTRLATIKCEQSLAEKLRDEWLALLPEMLPFIAELREDDDEMVERETQRWIGMMEGILGEDLEGMLQ